MFDNTHLIRVRQSFADQFSDDGRGFVYRKYQKGKAFRLSKVERDAFVEDFNKRIRYAVWSIIPVTFGLIMLLVWLVPDTNSVAAQIATWAGIAAILLLFMVVFYRAWGAPSRDLKRRNPEGLALSKDEARALDFSKMTYGRIALAALMGIVLVWKMSTKVDVLHGPGLIWLGLGAAIVLLAGVQAIRKWRFNQP